MNCNSTKSHIRSICKQHGVNLIEIMVAMTIGLFLVLGATTLYVNSKKTSDVDDNIARLNETARYAMSIIESDVRMANYWGLNRNPTTITNWANRISIGASNNPNYCGAGYATNIKPTNILTYIESYNDDYLYANLSTACPPKNSRQEESDSLTIRRAATTSAASTDISRIQLCSTRSSLTLVPRDTLSTNQSASTACPNGEIHDLITNGYYVDTGSDQDITLPSLRRKTLTTKNYKPDFADIEILPGVEDMQIELGWDNSNSTTTTPTALRYITSDNLPSEGRIVSVRIWLLIRSEKPDPAFTDSKTYSYSDKNYPVNDHFRRILVSKTIFIRNS